MTTPGYRDDVNPRAVLLSHAHADHVGYISLLRPDIPVVTGGLTAAIAKAMQDGGQSTDDSQTVFPASPHAAGRTTRHRSQDSLPTAPLVTR